MSASIPVFAGLGSRSLWESSRKVLTHGSQGETRGSLECQVLLRSCLQAFRDGITRAQHLGLLRIRASDADAIRLSDFAVPATLLDPAPKYHRNVVVQHVTTFVSQIAHYLQSGPSDGLDSGSDAIVATAGYCVGLLPAAALALSRDTLDLLARAQALFNVALWLGIHAERVRYEELELSGMPFGHHLPWGVVVEGIPLADAERLISNEEDVYIAGVNNSSSVTFAGRGAKLKSFTDKMLHAYRTTPVEIYSRYHHRVRLTDMMSEVMDSVSSSSSVLADAVYFRRPIALGDGSWMETEGPLPLRDVVTSILEHILLQATRWDNVQAAIATKANDYVAAYSKPIAILNFGPGYGFSPRLDGLNLSHHASVSNVAANAPSQKHADEGFLPDDIAIVGMAVDLPGAPDYETLWRNLCDGVNTCTEIPTSRFNVNDYYATEAEPGKSHPKLHTKYGNFVEDIFMFDNALFDISPREAKSMDPQQRIMLQVAYRALEDAGYTPDSTASNNRYTFGCWVGNATLDYTDNLSRDIDVYYSPGTLRTFLSARISYVFGWSGPSITVDTACSSSVVALHQAARAIAAGDCRAALVGACNAITSPDMYLGLDRAHFLSPSGQCKAFDASADGYCRSEGAGAFVIKRVGDAIADGDRIHAVIRAIDINQSGNTHSITHPHAPTQEALFKHMLNKAAVNPHDVTVVELHGTGTQAGDPNEVASVRQAICSNRNPSNQLHLTSIKANIGHLEAASGMAGLAKLVLMIKNGRIPPQVSLKTLNPRIQELGVDGAVISQRGDAWNPPNGAPRIGMLNNFGAGGSNGAVILQEYLADEFHDPTVQDISRVCGIAAKSEKAVLQLRDNLVKHLQTLPKTPAVLRDVCTTLTARRMVQPHRISVTARSMNELIQKLSIAKPTKLQERRDGVSHTVFLYSGQGSQYLGMGRELRTSSAIFAQTVSECERWLIAHGYPGCEEIIASESDTGEATSDPSKIQAFQAAVFVIELGLARVLMSCGIKPAAVIGHSLGEYAALVAAGILQPFDALAVVALRAKLIVERCSMKTTGMLAVNASEEIVRGIIHSNDALSSLVITCCNSATDCVVGGAVEVLKNLVTHLKEHKLATCKLLRVPLGYHSAAMDPILDELNAATKDLMIRPAQIPFVSTLFGRIIDVGETLETSYFSRHCREPVAFDTAVKALLASSIGSSIARFLELGPHPALLPALGLSVDKKQIELLCTLRRELPATDSLAQLFAHLYTATDLVQWRHFTRDQGRSRLVNLPGMPFFKQEYMTMFKVRETNAPLPLVEKLSDTTGFLTDIIHLPSDSDPSAVFGTALLRLRDLISGHIVGDFALCPASVYHELVFGALRALHADEGSDSGNWALADVEYKTPLLYHEGPETAVRVSMDPKAEGVYVFSVSTTTSGSTDSSAVHCTGFARQKQSKTAKRQRQATELARKRMMFQSPSTAETQQILHTNTLYDKVFTRVVRYSKPYQNVNVLHLGADGRDVYARCQYPAVHIGDSGLRANQAVFMDVLLHVAGFAANFQADDDGDLYICKHVRSVQDLSPPGKPGDQFEVFCTLVDTNAKDQTWGDAVAVDTNSGQIIAMIKGMEFQRVPLAKIHRSFGLLSRSSPPAKMIRARSTTTVSSRPQQALSQPGSHEPTDRSAARALDSPLESRFCARELIAELCQLPVTSVTHDMPLDALGIDSLMTLELQSELRARGQAIDSVVLKQCRLVADVEALCTQDATSSSKFLLSLSRSTISSSGISAPSTMQSSGYLVPSSASSVHSSDDGMSSHTLKRTTIQSLPSSKSTSSSTLMLLAEACAVDKASLVGDVELQSLGVDSLLMLELHARVEQLVPNRNISLDDLSRCVTVADVENLVQSPTPPSRHQNAEVTTTHDALLSKLLPSITTALHLHSNPEVIQPPSPKTGGRVPLFLIHDGSGICTHYHRLSPLDRPVFAIHDPLFTDPSESWPTLEAMAEHYASLINPSDTILLGGWSFGGVVAYQIAEILRQQGKQVQGLVLIDSPPPVDHRPLSASIIEAVTGGNQCHRGDLAKQIQKLASMSFASCTQLLVNFQPLLPSRSSELVVKKCGPPTVLLRSVEGWKRPGEQDARVENAWLQDRSDPRTATDEWEVLLQQKLHCIDIPGDHFAPFEARNVQEVSNAIDEACRRLDGVGSI
ncbi:polyketide synthase [Lecanosticta acicola]|uniref:Polyketide synthase n=1 Tax=Lecanosticta acicola TaxID=111012 RepID=A0AAI8YZ22_9PEZI|nr:polyketide synthase [Lecanosticta acicola]